MEWQLEQTDHRPEPVEISGKTVTQRRNIREIEVTDPDGNTRTAYESEMRFITAEEYIYQLQVENQSLSDTVDGILSDIIPSLFG
jgi:hypothetical protein